MRADELYPCLHMLTPLGDPAMFRSSDKKIDKPDQVAFAKAIGDNLPGRKDTEKLWVGVGIAYALGKVSRRGKKR